MAVAFVTLAIGTTAVFRTDNQAGSVALLAVSVVLMIIGLLGRIPERGTVGQIAYTFGPIADALDSPDLVEREKAADVVLEKAEEHVGSLEPNAQAVTHAAAIMRRRQDRAMVEAVASLAHTMGLTVDLNTTSGADLRIESGSTGEQFVPFPIVIRRAADLIAASQTAGFARSIGSRTALMITPQGRAAEAPDALTIGGVQVFIVAIPPQSQGRERIREGLRRAIAHATSSAT